MNYYEIKIGFHVFDEIPCSPYKSRYLLRLDLRKQG